MNSSFLILFLPLYFLHIPLYFLHFNDLISFNLFNTPSAFSSEIFSSNPKGFLVSNFFKEFILDFEPLLPTCCESVSFNSAFSCSNVVKMLGDVIGLRIPFFNGLTFFPLTNLKSSQRTSLTETPTFSASMCSASCSDCQELLTVSISLTVPNWRSSELAILTDSHWYQ